MALGLVMVGCKRRPLDRQTGCLLHQQQCTGSKHACCCQIKSQILTTCCKGKIHHLSPSWSCDKISSDTNIKACYILQQHVAGRQILFGGQDLTLQSTQGCKFCKDYHAFRLSHSDCYTRVSYTPQSYLSKLAHSAISYQNDGL